MAIAAPQLRHRPRNATQLTIGMLSYHAIPTPHPGQRERGRTTDAPCGHRTMHTLRNEPTTAPSTKASRLMRAAAG